MTKSVIGDEAASEAETHSSGIPNNMQPTAVTDMFFQRSMSLSQRKLWQFCGNLADGCAFGYFYTAQALLQKQGVSYTQQALLSAALYPYPFKFLLAPFLDRFYSLKLGRSKTYILLSNLVNGLLMIFLSTQVETWMKTKEVGLLTIFLFTINLMGCLREMANDCWVLTMFDDKNRSEANVYQYLGTFVGMFFSFNLFIPLNDLEWLNDNIFTKNNLESPLVNQSDLCLAMGILYLIQFTILLLFVAEEMYIKAEEMVTFTQVLKVFPRHFTNKYMLKFILYFFSCRFIVYMLDPIFDLLSISNGYINVGRSQLANLQTLLCPLVFLLIYVATYYTRPGYLMRLFHISIAIMTLHILFRYISILDLITNRDKTRMIITRGFSGLVTSVEYSYYLLYAYFYNITNPKFGNTSMCILASLTYQTMYISQTVGFYLMDYISFEVFIPVCLVVQTILLIGLFGFAKTLDKMDASLFDLSYDLEPQEQKMSAKAGTSDHTKTAEYSFSSSSQSKF